MHLKLLIDKIIEIIENEIMKKQEFGAGIWHFATYLDRYATDGYGEPRSVIEAIELAGKVTDLVLAERFFDNQSTLRQGKPGFSNALAG